jgi:predicted NodU family carbamoyl transferase
MALWWDGFRANGIRSACVGNRSILADPLPDMQRILNVKIKFRKLFVRLPPVLEEDAAEYFQKETGSLLTCYLKQSA